MFCGCGRKPVEILVFVASHIALIYGLWFRSWTWIIVGIVVLAIGKLLYKDCECETEEVKPRKKRRK